MHSTDKQNQNWLSVIETAQRIGVSNDVMYKTLKSSPFPHYHFGVSEKGVIRIPIKPLEQFEQGSWNPDKKGVLYGDAPPLCQRCKSK